jgi:hypothetical protein
MASTIFVVSFVAVGVGMGVGVVRALGTIVLG